MISWSGEPPGVTVSDMIAGRRLVMRTLYLGRSGSGGELVRLVKWWWSGGEVVVKWWWSGGVVVSCWWSGGEVVVKWWGVGEVVSCGSDGDEEGQQWWEYELRCCSKRDSDDEMIDGNYDGNGDVSIRLYKRRRAVIIKKINIRDKKGRYMKKRWRWKTQKTKSKVKRK